MLGPFQFFKPVMDAFVTVTLWLYYIVGYLLFFSPFYLASYLLNPHRNFAFQKLNHIFCRSFFVLLRSITPGLSIRIQEDVKKIRSSVIVSNHVSYLDPLLLISCFEKQATIVKTSIFRIPIFGHVLKTAGYIPSTGEGDFAGLLIDRIEQMPDYLKSGGNLFIFPEGTRSRDGALGRLHEGAFKIARHCHAPIRILYIRNTDKLYTPGKFLFNTCIRNPIDVEWIGTIEPDYENTPISSIIQNVKDRFNEHPLSAN